MSGVGPIPKAPDKNAAWKAKRAGSFVTPKANSNAAITKTIAQLAKDQEPDS